MLNYHVESNTYTALQHGAVTLTVWNPTVLNVHAPSTYVPTYTVDLLCNDSRDNKAWTYHGSLYQAGPSGLAPPL